MEREFLVIWWLIELYVEHISCFTPLIYLTGTFTDSKMIEIYHTW